MKFTRILILSFCTLVCISCSSSDSKVESNNDTIETTNSNTDVNVQDKIVDVSGKITNEVVDKACSCVNEAKKGEEKALSEVITKIQECMGGNSETFVKGLFGEDASDKEINDALISLKTMMEQKCPLQ